MKKIVLIFALLSLPAFATDIPYTNDSYTSSTCDSGVLQHDSGTVRLRARYEPNTINIRWYNNNTEITPANTAANTCDYDDDLTLPETQLTRTGYTFAGWRVRPQYDFSTLPTNELGTEAYGRGKSSRRICYNENGIGEGSVACNMDDFNYLHNGEWKIVFSWGTIYGMSMCSSTPASLLGESGHPIESENGAYCWCMATGYVPNGESIKYAPISVGWVSATYAGSICRSVCGGRCAIYNSHAYGAGGRYSFLSNLFQSVSQ